jgi:hypothetical protein
MRKRRPAPPTTIPADALASVQGGCKKRKCKGSSSAEVSLQIGGAMQQAAPDPSMAQVQIGGQPMGGPMPGPGPQGYRSPAVAYVPAQGSGGGSDPMMDMLMLSLMFQK